MTKFGFATLAACAALALPVAVHAQSQEETPSKEVTIGFTTGLHDLGIKDELREATGRFDVKDRTKTVGGFAAIDKPLGSSPLFAGIEGNVNVGVGSGINYEYGSSLRLGYRGMNGAKAYVRGGYQWVDINLGDILGVPEDAVPAGLQGHASDYLVGAGVELPAGKVILRGNVDTVGFDTVRGTLGVGVRF